MAPRVGPSNALSALHRGDRYERPFLRLPAPTEGEVEDVAARTAKRVVAILKKRGRSIEGLSGGEEGGDIEPAG